jgi:hypothetical protein
VSMTAQQNSTSDFLSRAQLVKLRLKAMRAGVWYRALPRIDRVLVDLTIRVADIIRSPHLARSILSIAGKLEGLLESKLQRAVREFGLPIARKLSLFAQKWGNAAAEKWASDDGFARYWAAIKLNERFSG